ncbi:hypothetical protein ACUT8K_000496 [Vibrio parahaemolyticus]|uniref:hypothetical protein n=1 Tax=Vibrio parahaemolyticus TaxID=670 RepID=UPI000470ACFB|nr:hypothetical protein [Vibrio parahaemolyticus]KIT48535.1 hypothetical protein H331_16260 [Vibrio parahaemolyticus 3644]KIT57576.1 hypothetical protein H336_19045 [Vibrio parahaemolyticus EN9701072]EGQ8241618.1 hypothetical protein [Vibrio parahaemolyticus]EGQ8386913.1 hypothetical protein [Vibrio parahaemolyticus]EGQ9127426.1 hypothetical protein [Vibrio parahaemolyticus]
MSYYIDECKRLSITGRSAISLLIFERFCLLNELNALEINEFLDYLWKWPLVDGPDEFEPWEANRVTLVNCGLGDDFSEDLLNTLTLSGVSEYQFRSILGGIIEILWGSFWGAAENEQSMVALENVISASDLEQLPVLTPFKFSLFSQNGGWGDKITSQDLEFWRTCVKYA